MASIMLHLPRTKQEEIHRSNQLHLHHEIQQGGNIFGSAWRGIKKAAKSVGHVAGQTANIAASSACLMGKGFCAPAKEMASIANNAVGLLGGGIHRHESQPPPRPGQYRMDSRVLGGGHH